MKNKFCLIAFSGAVLANAAFAVNWKYTTQKPGGNWTSPGFSTSGWEQGEAGFGAANPPGSFIQTEWSSSDIWMRRDVQLTSIPDNPAWLVHHDEDLTVYLNGKEVLNMPGYSTSYQLIPLTDSAKASLKKGRNLLAAHCHQTDGGQYADVHLVDADNLPALAELMDFTLPPGRKFLTQWGESLNPETVWQEYPRPQMKRNEWTNLNGKWQYTVTEKSAARPDEWAGDILVPFCLESQLSGVQRLLEPYEALWYRRTFPFNGDKSKRLLLNFEAVDYISTCWVNGKKVGSHKGGNLPFSFDITDVVKEGENEIVLQVTDATADYQLRGKQVLNAGGIFYTRVSGIWQTVWLEQVPQAYIQGIAVHAGMDGVVKVDARTVGGKGTLELQVLDGSQQVALVTGAAGSSSVTATVNNPMLWSPDSPHLYVLKVRLLGADGRVIDEVDSYTGLRTVGKKVDKNGDLRFTLNGEEIFHWGPLDQGWWPDGLLTPPSLDAVKFEIDWLKDAGFNMIRKHIKVEPRTYYYHCDKVGMMVWQDQVSGSPSPRWTLLDPNPVDAVWPDEHHAQWMEELDEMITLLDSFPSIVVWTPFNEAWGQHRTMDVGKWIVERDPSRLINIASGGNFWPVGDIADRHAYPNPDFLLQDVRFDDYVKVVGEFGGHGWPVQGHLWDPQKNNWGYGGLPKTIDDYLSRYKESIHVLAELKRRGIAGGVYTQTTDVEGEINGLMTYDRKVIKIPAGELAEIHRVLTQPSE
ncbi:MAG: hypothetical protein JXR25_15290 [Pontiellaceae bacterium]|nr:hypothetical protein [Pontiellaceae bacterium]MBN2786185.1 hypothetical protein [Pontiellaceae bacterium]